MPTINLTNNTSLNIAATSADNPTLKRYLQNPLVFLTKAGFEKLVGSKIAALDSTAFPLTATLTGAGSFAVEGTSLDVQAGASASVGLLTGDDVEGFYSSLQIDKSPAVTALVSFEVQGTLNAGPSASVSDFSLGITKGATVGITSFSTAVDTDTFVDATQRAISSLTIPHNIDDLKSLPVNSICEIDASSSLQLTASVSYNFVNNPLATASIPKLPAIAINATSGATLEATATHTGDHTVTIAKLPNGRLRVSVSLSKTDDLEASLTVSAGVSANVGNYDALTFLLNRISPDSAAEAKKLAAEMPAGQAQQLSGDIKAAIDAALSNTLQASLKAALDASKFMDRLFLYEIDLTALDADGQSAIQSALRGDFTKITRTGPALAGIHELDSALTVASQITHSLTLHLLGIFNWESTNTFIKKSTIDYTRDTHEIVLSDETIKLSTNNLNAEKLREVVVKGVTLTLPASANTPEAKTPINVVFFERKAGTHPSTMRQFVNILQSVGSSSALGASTLLGRKLNDYGTTSLSLSLSLTPVQCKQLFIGGDGKPYPWTYYLQHACNAGATILDGDGDPVSASRLKLFRSGQAFWSQLRDAGAAANQVRLMAEQGIVQTAEVDVITFIWWSAAMEAYAKALAAGQSLVQVGKQVVKDGTLGFNEPWLILATREMLQTPAVDSAFTSSLLSSGPLAMTMKK